MTSSQFPTSTSASNRQNRNTNVCPAHRIHRPIIQRRRSTNNHQRSRRKQAAGAARPAHTHTSAASAPCLHIDEQYFQCASPRVVAVHVQRRRVPGDERQFIYIYMFSAAAGTLYSPSPRRDEGHRQVRNLTAHARPAAVRPPSVVVQMRSTFIHPPAPQRACVA